MEHQNHSDGRKESDGFINNYTEFLNEDFENSVPDFDIVPGGFGNNGNTSSNTNAGSNSNGLIDNVLAAYDPFPFQQAPSQNGLDTIGGLLDPSIFAGFQETQQVPSGFDISTSQLPFSSTGQEMSLSNVENGYVQMNSVEPLSFEGMDDTMDVSHYGPNATPQQGGDSNTAFTNGLSREENGSSNSPTVGNLNVQKQTQSNGQANPNAQHNPRPSGPIGGYANGQNQFGGPRPNAQQKAHPSGPVGADLSNSHVQFAGHGNPNVQQSPHPSGRNGAGLSNSENQLGRQGNLNAQQSSHPSEPKGAGFSNGQNQVGGQASPSAQQNTQPVVKKHMSDWLNRMGALMAKTHFPGLNPIRKKGTMYTGYMGKNSVYLQDRKSPPLPKNKPKQQSQGRRLSKNNNGPASGTGQDHARFFPGMKANTNPTPSNQPLRLSTSTTPKVDLSGATPTDLSSATPNDPQQLGKLFGATVSAGKNVPSPSNSTGARTQKNGGTSAGEAMAAEGPPAPARQPAPKRPIAEANGAYQEGVAGAEGQMSTGRPPVIPSDQSPSGVDQSAEPLLPVASRIKITDPKIEELLKSAYAFGIKYGMTVGARASHTLLLQSMESFGERTAVHDSLGIPSDVVNMDANSLERSKALTQNAKGWRGRIVAHVEETERDDAIDGKHIHPGVMTKLADIAPEYFQSPAQAGKTDPQPSNQAGPSSHSQLNKASVQSKGGFTPSPGPSTAFTSVNTTPSLPERRDKGKAPMYSTGPSPHVPDMPNANLIQSQMEMAMNGGGQPRPTRDAFVKPVASSQQLGFTPHGSNGIVSHGNGLVSQVFSQPSTSNQQPGFIQNGGANGIVPQAVYNPTATIQQTGFAQKNGNGIKPGVSNGPAQGNILMPQVSQTGLHTHVYHAAGTTQGDMTGYGHSIGAGNGALQQSISRPVGGHGLPGGPPPLQAGNVNQPNQGSLEQQTGSNNGSATEPKRGKKRGASQVPQQAGQQPARQAKAPKHTKSSTTRPRNDASAQATTTTPSSAGSLTVASQTIEAPSSIESTRPGNDTAAPSKSGSLADASQNIKAPTTIVPTECEMPAPETVPSVPASEGKDSDALPDDSTGPPSVEEPIDFSEIDAMWERGKAELGMPAKPTPDPVLNTGSAELDRYGIRDHKNHAKRLARKCLAVIDERIEKTGSAGGAQSQPVDGSGGVEDDGIDQREVAAKAEFRRASVWLDRVLGSRSGPQFIERWDMDEFGLGFHMLEKIQLECEVPDEEMRERNLMLANHDADILKVLPPYGPVKHAIDTKMTKLHYEIRRAMPAGLLKELEDRMNFYEWLANADMNGDAVNFLVAKYFMKQYLPRR